jgi:hypothetical protein
MDSANAARTRSKTMVAKKTPSYEKGKYTEAKDKKKDAAMTKGMSAAEKKKFEAADKKHAKPKTMASDKKKDAKIIKGIKAKRK